jgi:hypothetical protein
VIGKPADLPGGEHPLNQHTRLAGSTVRSVSIELANILVPGLDSAKYLDVKRTGHGGEDLTNATNSWAKETVSAGATFSDPHDRRYVLEVFGLQDGSGDRFQVLKGTLKF